jgi:hypothetical protein
LIAERPVIRNPYLSGAEGNVVPAPVRNPRHRLAITNPKEWPRRLARSIAICTLKVDIDLSPDLRVVSRLSFPAHVEAGPVLYGVVVAAAGARNQLVRGLEIFPSIPSLLVEQLSAHADRSRPHTLAVLEAAIIATEIRAQNFIGFGGVSLLRA